MKFSVVKRLLIACGAVIFILVGLGLFLRSKYQVPILMYHSIDGQRGGNPDKTVRVSLHIFEKQMRFLKTNHYNVISLDDYIQALHNNTKLPHNTVVLTFDDGYEDNYRNVYPILKKYNFPATIFVITSMIGQHDFLTADEIRAMDASGLITFGSHTVHHKYLPHIHDRAELRHEIFDSKKDLEALLKKPVMHFCYPIGGASSEARACVIEAGYKSGAAISPGLTYPNNDPFVLKRIKISDNADNFFIFWFEVSGFYKYLKELDKSFHKNKINCARRFNASSYKTE